MDGHTLLGEITLGSSIVADGGPRSCLRRGKLPEHYFPGRFLAGRPSGIRAAITRAVNSSTPPAPWFIREIVSYEEMPHFDVPPEPVDRRWARRGRWATP